MVKILVVGLSKTDAGKTTVAQAALHALRDLGEKPCGFKPKAGNNIWYDFDVVKESLAQGRLYGKDAKLLRQASQTDLTEETITPVHRLWAEPPTEFRSRVMELPFFILDRVTLSGEQPRTVVSVNKTLPFEHGAETLLGQLYVNAEEVLPISTLKDLRMFEHRFFEQAIALAHRAITKRYDSLVYESYADIALPWLEITVLDLVLGVEPGRVAAYDPHKWLDACGLSREIHRDVEISTASILPLMKPLASHRVPPVMRDGVQQELEPRIHSLLTQTLPR